MCLIVFALESHPKYSLVLASNRDEYYQRPTLPAGFWPDHSAILAGRDSKSGGTWLGLTRAGRLATVTNFRAPQWQVPNPPSRGLLVADYLEGQRSPREFMEHLKMTGNRYQGFNLLFGDLRDLFYFSNRTRNGWKVSAGVHGLSNHLLDTPWPKVTSAKEKFESLIRQGADDPEEYFAVLADPTPFPDERLPDTGIGTERERLLSPIFINGRSYGTRYSTLIFIDRSQRMRFFERCHDPECPKAATAEFNLDAFAKASM